MTPDQFIEALQTTLGPDYTVSLHPKKREEPQFDVAMNPELVEYDTHDENGALYGVTFSVQKDVLSELGYSSLLVATWAVIASKEIDRQIRTGLASPRIKGKR